MRLTPQNAKATYVAGSRTFVLGGAVIFLFGAGGISLALLRVTTFAWEQGALIVIGALVVLFGLLVPRGRTEPP